MISIVDGEVDPAKYETALRMRATGAGAIVTFSGIVRGEDGVTALELEHYDRLTEFEIGEAAAEASARWPLIDLEIVHRIGRIPVGETVVFVGTASAHRRAAFEACDFLMDYLKTRAPFWKREWRGDIAKWIEPRDEDYADTARWARKEY
jgi:molybdopterin synthase catalytic subunit